MVENIVEKSTPGKDQGAEEEYVELTPEQIAYLMEIMPEEIAFTPEWKIRVRLRAISDLEELINSIH